MDSLKHELKTLIVEALDLEDLRPEDIGDDTPLFSADGLALDSIDALEIGVALRRKWGVQLEAGDAGNKAHFQSVATLAALVHSQTASVQ